MKGLQYDWLWCDRRNFGDITLQKGFGHAERKVKMRGGHGEGLQIPNSHLRRNHQKKCGLQSEMAIRYLLNRL